MKATLFALFAIAICVSACTYEDIHRNAAGIAYHLKRSNEVAEAGVHVLNKANTIIQRHGHGNEDLFVLSNILEDLNRTAHRAAQSADAYIEKTKEKLHDLIDKHRENATEEFRVDVDRLFDGLETAHQTAHGVAEGLDLAAGLGKRFREPATEDFHANMHAVAQGLHTAANVAGTVSHVARTVSHAAGAAKEGLNLLGDVAGHFGGEVEEFHLQQYAGQLHAAARVAGTVSHVAGTVSHVAGAASKGLNFLANAADRYGGYEVEAFNLHLEHIANNVKTAGKVAESGAKALDEAHGVIREFGSNAVQLFQYKAWIQDLNDTAHLIKDDITEHVDKIRDIIKEHLKQNNATIEDFTAEHPNAHLYHALDTVETIHHTANHIVGGLNAAAHLAKHFGQVKENEQEDFHVDMHEVADGLHDASHVAGAISHIAGNISHVAGAAQKGLNFLGNAADRFGGR